MDLPDPGLINTPKLESPMCDLKQVVSGKVIMSEKREGWRFI